ncbi:MAG: cytochrome P450 [Myxococcota bacterium]
MDPVTYLGTLILLIVGATTRLATRSRAVLALNENPKEYDKLRADPGLIPTMVDEVIRWQTPLAHMRFDGDRRHGARRQTDQAGRQGRDVACLGERDETAIDRANEFLIDRPDSKRHHLSFGWGVHFCMGSRMAEMQLRVLWEEIMKRYRMVEVMGEPVRVASCCAGIQTLLVRLHPK